MQAPAATPSLSVQGLPASNRERSSTQRGSGKSTGCFPFPLPSFLPAEDEAVSLLDCPRLPDGLAPQTPVPSSTSWFSLTLGRLQIGASQGAKTSLPRASTDEGGRSPGECRRGLLGRGRGWWLGVYPSDPPSPPGPVEAGQTSLPAAHRGSPSGRCPARSHRIPHSWREKERTQRLWGHRRERSEKSCRSGLRGKGKTRGDEKRS